MKKSIIISVLMLLSIAAFGQGTDLTKAIQNEKIAEYADSIEWEYHRSYFTLRIDSIPCVSNSIIKTSETTAKIEHSKNFKIKRYIRWHFPYYKVTYHCPDEKDVVLYFSESGEKLKKDKLSAESELKNLYCVYGYGNLYFENEDCLSQCINNPEKIKITEVSEDIYYIHFYSDNCNELCIKEHNGVFYGGGKWKESLHITLGKMFDDLYF